MKKFHFAGYVIGAVAHIRAGTIDLVGVMDVEIPRPIPKSMSPAEAEKFVIKILCSTFVGKRKFEWDCLAEENIIVANKGKEGFHIEPLVRGVPQGRFGIFQSTFDRTIRQLQTNLPWSSNYSRDFLASTVKHKNLVHALSHVGKAAGKLYGLVDDMDHGLAIDEDPTLHDQFGKYVADLVICSLRIANEFPGGALDLQKAVEARIERNWKKNSTKTADKIAMTEVDEIKEEKNIADWLFEDILGLPNKGYACGGYADGGNFDRAPSREDVLPNRRTVHIGTCPVNLKEPPRERYIVGTSYMDCARVFFEKEARATNVTISIDFDLATADRLFHNNVRDLFAKGIDGRRYR